MKQMTFYDARYTAKRKQARKDLSLDGADGIDRAALPKDLGRSSLYPLITRLRLHSYEITLFRQLSGPQPDQVLNEKTILNFRRLMEKNELTSAILRVVRGGRPRLEAV